MGIDPFSIVVYLVLVLAIGILAGRGVRSLQHFSVAGRSYLSAVVFATLSASFIVGLKGVVVAGIIAVVMFSADSFLNGAAVAFTNDVVGPLRRRSMSDRQALILAKATTLLSGGGSHFCYQNQEYPGSAHLCLPFLGPGHRHTTGRRILRYQGPRRRFCCRMRRRTCRDGPVELFGASARRGGRLDHWGVVQCRVFRHCKKGGQMIAPCAPLSSDRTLMHIE